LPLARLSSSPVVVVASPDPFRIFGVSLCFLLAGPICLSTAPPLAAVLAGSILNELGPGVAWILLRHFPQRSKFSGWALVVFPILVKILFSHVSFFFTCLKGDRLYLPSAPSARSTKVHHPLWIFPRSASLFSCFPRPPTAVEKGWSYLYPSRLTYKHRLWLLVKPSMLSRSFFATFFLPLAFIS